jgi:hypothetical protein
MRHSLVPDPEPSKKGGTASDFTELGESERYFRKEKNMEGGKRHLYDHVKSCLLPCFLPIRP